MNKLIYVAIIVHFIFVTTAFASKGYTRPSDAEIKSILTPEQFTVTQEKGTEKPFENAFWNNKEPGIYVDIVTGEPLFSSLDKYDSKTGWPSFTRPLEPLNIVTRSDNSWFIHRTEVLSKVGQSHLGHVFTDGPPPTHLRWCINSAALKFIPVKELKTKGYEKYMHLFSEKNIQTPRVMGH